MTLENIVLTNLENVTNNSHDGNLVTYDFLSTDSNNRWGFDVGYRNLKKIVIQYDFYSHYGDNQDFEIYYHDDTGDHLLGIGTFVYGTDFTYELELDDFIVADQLLIMRGGQAPAEDGACKCKEINCYHQPIWNSVYGIAKTSIASIYGILTANIKKVYGV